MFSFGYNESKNKLYRVIQGHRHRRAPLILGEESIVIFSLEFALQVFVILLYVLFWLAGSGGRAGLTGKVSDSEIFEIPFISRPPHTLCQCAMCAKIK